MMQHTEALADWISGAHLVDVHEPDGPEAGYVAVYVWHGSLTVNVYGVTEEGWEAVDVFTFAEQPSRSDVLERIAEHFRENMAYADSLDS